MLLRTDLMIRTENSKSDCNCLEINCWSNGSLKSIILDMNFFSNFYTIKHFRAWHNYNNKTIQNTFFGFYSLQVKKITLLKFPHISQVRNIYRQTSRPSLPIYNKHTYSYRVKWEHIFWMFEAFSPVVAFKCALGKFLSNISALTKAKLVPLCPVWHF